MAKTKKLSRKEKQATWDNTKWFKHYRSQYYASKISKYVCSVAPIAVLFGVKWNEYFKLIDAGSKWKFSIGCILAIIVGVIAVYQDIKKTESKEKQLILNAVGWWVAAVIIYCFKAVFDDLLLIVMVEAGGQTGSYIFSLLEQNRLNWTNMYKDGAVKSKTMKNEMKDVANSNKGIPVD